MERKDIEAVAGWTDRAWGTWILESLIKYHLVDRTRHAFRPLQTVFGVDYSVTADLAALYFLLDIEERLAFKGGLAIALARVSITPQNREAFSDLLEMARRCNADEVLLVLASRIRNELPEILSTADAAQFIRWSIFSLAKFAGTSSSLTNDSFAAATALLQIVDDDVVADVLLLLAQLKPTSLSETVSRNWAKLSAALGEVNDRSADEARHSRKSEMARALCDALPLDVVGATLSLPIATYDVNWWQLAVFSELTRRGWTPQSTPNDDANQPDPIVSVVRAREVPLSRWNENTYSLFPFAGETP